MLVVLGIVLVVMSMVLAGGVSLRRAARETMCLTQLRDLALSVTNYAARYDGALPLGSWADLGPLPGAAAQDGGGKWDPLSESMLSARGFAAIPGTPADLFGPGVGPLPTVRDLLQPFMNTKEPVWRCPMQREIGRTTPGPPPPYSAMLYVDDERGFRPGYRFMMTLDLLPLVKSASGPAKELGKLLGAEQLVVRNVGGLKLNRIRTMDNVGTDRIVLVMDASPSFHSKHPVEFWELSGESANTERRVHLSYLDGHADSAYFKGHDGWIRLLHGPVRQRWWGREMDTEFPEHFKVRE